MMDRNLKVIIVGGIAAMIGGGLAAASGIEMLAEPSRSAPQYQQGAGVPVRSAPWYFSQHPPGALHPEYSSVQEHAGNQ